MAVTGRAAVRFRLPVSVSKSEARHGQAVSRSRRRPGASERDPGCGPCLRRVLPGYKKRECLWTFSFFVHSNRGQHGCSGERLQPSQMHVIFGDVPRCSLLCGSGGDHSSRPEKSFFRVGESARGGGTVFTKNVPPPLVQNSVAETIRRRRRSRRRHRDWRRSRQGGPDGRLPACAGGCPGGGCIRSRRCAPDGGRR